MPISPFHGRSAAGPLPLLVFCLALSGCSSSSAVSETQNPSPTRKAAETPGAEPPAEAAADPLETVARYPRRHEGTTGTVVMHAPQIESWPDFERVTARAAVEVTPKGLDQTFFGSVVFSADTYPNLELRQVAVEKPTIDALQFPGTDEDTAEDLKAIVKAAVQGKPQQVPLDVVLEYIAPEAEVPTPEGLNLEPPPIYVSTTPAILINIDGEPLLAPAGDTGLKYVINTNWDLFSAGGRWYLLNDDHWLTTGDEALKSGWSAVLTLPAAFSKLPADDPNWQRVASQVPARSVADPMPEVFVSQRPAELILLEGEPQFEAIGETGLSHVNNTESNLFSYGNSYYYLVSGRWFTTRHLEGPWASVTTLPPAFAEIPEDHPRAAVRASVAGTDEARLASLEAVIPRKATISRDAGQNVSVTYQGEPQFEPIDNTGVNRAVNSANDVFEISGNYYLCDNAVWYVSETPSGPWAVAGSVPQEIYTIPPSSPSYHVTHVEVYDSTPDYVVSGYTSAYYGTHVYYGVPVYGTGWYYPPYWYYSPYYGYPIYYGYPYSYGFGGFYNPNTGTYGRAAAVYGPYGGYGRAAAYNPNTGMYSRAGAVWDSDEVAMSARGFNPRTGTAVAANGYADGDSGWGESLITRGDRWIASESEWTGNTLDRQFETSRGVTGESTVTVNGDTVTRERELQQGDRSLSSETVRGEQGTVKNIETGQGDNVQLGRTTEGDLYAGKDGNVYKREDGNWYQHDGETWQPREPSDQQRQAMDQRRSDFGERERQSQANRQQRRDTPRSYDYSGSRSLSSDRYRDLNRSYDARRNGYSRHNSYQRNRSMARPRRGGRRR